MKRMIALALLPLLGACEASNPGHGPWTNRPCEGTECGGTTDGPLAQLGVEMDVAGDWIVDNVAVEDCASMNTCILELEPGTHVITAQNPDYVILDKTVEVNADATQVTFDGESVVNLGWTEFGDCGVDVGDRVFCDNDGDTRDVETNTVDDRGVVLRGLPFDGLPMLGYDFEYDAGGGIVLTGFVDQEFNSIHYETWIDGNLEEAEDMVSGACP